MEHDGPEMVRKTYKIAEVAKLLGISRCAAYEAAKREGEGSLPVPVIRIGSRMVVSKAALDRVLAGEA